MIKLKWSQKHEDPAEVLSTSVDVVCSSPTNPTPSHRTHSVCRPDGWSQLALIFMNLLYINAAVCESVRLCVCPETFMFTFFPNKSRSLKRHLALCGQSGHILSRLEPISQVNGGCVALCSTSTNPDSLVGRINILYIYTEWEKWIGSNLINLTILHLPLNVSLLSDITSTPFATSTSICPSDCAASDSTGQHILPPPPPASLRCKYY